MPDQNETAMRTKYELLFEYLKVETGLAYELIIPDSYGDLVDMFGRQQIEMAFFGGFTFIQARKRYKAVPLILGDIDERFTSVVLVRSDNPAKDLKDLKGLRFSFGSRLSTSGHLMPRYFLKERNIAPEKFFREVQYSGTHDETAYRVRDGRADAGVANSRIVKNLYRDGRLKPSQVKVLWVTPMYLDHIWAVHPSLNSYTRSRIREAFLALTWDQPAHKVILQALGRKYYLPADMDDFFELEQIVADMNL